MVAGTTLKMFEEGARSPSLRGASIEKHDTGNIV